MSFQDQAGINRIRDALWQRLPGATVMIGAGFSKNAESAQGSMPSWTELAQSMCEQLYPDEKDQQRTISLAASNTTSGALRLAQEYKVAFGRRDLHRFLKKHVNDQLVQPCDFHKRLLQLPWRDVFTTNWDTLLERGRSMVINPSYSVVNSIDEIPISPTPRIVKLHGSLNGHFPLIFTEEDYRTFPQRFPPFVNMVQQSMMESVFLLLGFSGDDPNFLHWSGWVRDNLGESAPRIFLAGWLNLSNHRRRMLESRNVVSIDLACHPKSNQWPHSLRHKIATDWILRSLEYGRPYEVSEWPSPPRRAVESVESHLKPIQTVMLWEPKAEPQLISEHGQNGTEKVEKVRRLIEVWSYNRKNTYPGWLTAPSRIRTNMWSTSEYAKDILDELPRFLPMERLLSIRELTWRWGIMLNPLSEVEELSTRLERESSNVLASVDCSQRKVGGVNVSGAEWPEVLEAWIELNLALMTSARHRFDKNSFESRISSVLPFKDESDEINHRIIHEQCMWAVFSLDFVSLKKLLDEWDCGSTDPVWMMRKAALLFEIGEDEQAEEVNAFALAKIQQSNNNHQDIELSSREGWALFCAGQSSEVEEFWYASTEWQHRWDRFTPIQCNASLEMKRYEDSFQVTTTPEGGRPFDLGHAWVGGFSFSMNAYNRWVAAHRAVRLVEVAGLPPRRGNMTVASKLLELAARNLITHEPELATRLVLRAAEYKSQGTLNWRPFRWRPIRTLCVTKFDLQWSQLSRNPLHLCVN